MSGEKPMTKRGEAQEWSDGGGSVGMTGEGGVHGPGRSRVIPVPRSPQVLSRKFLMCLPVDTMHKFDSCDLLFLFFLCAKKHTREMAICCKN